MNAWVVVETLTEREPRPLDDWVQVRDGGLELSRLGWIWWWAQPERDKLLHLRGKPFHQDREARTNNFHEAHLNVSIISSAIVQNVTKKWTDQRPNSKFDCHSDRTSKSQRAKVWDSTVLLLGCEDEERSPNLEWGYSAFEGHFVLTTDWATFPRVLIQWAADLSRRLLSIYLNATNFSNADQFKVVNRPALVE